MAIRELTVNFTGIAPLLLNNPQCVDRFNKYSKRIAEINAKRTRRTDEDYHELGDLEIESKLYFDAELGVYIPSRWVMAAICKVSNKVAKIPKADIRASVFTTADKVKLEYEKRNLVKTPRDIIGNDFFRHKMLLPQGQVRIAKHVPIFHNWSFGFDLEFDDTVLDQTDITRILEHAALRGGFGDFRPTFGRAKAEVIHVK